jgi:endonuclease YncB( thermonuclease family)
VVFPGRARGAAAAAGLVLGLLAGAVRAEPFTGRVVAVTDGDTLKVLHGRRVEVVRLQGIDAPERRQAHGTRARQFAAGLAHGRPVTVLDRGRDRNGRLLAEVVLPDGRSLNQELVRAGYAWWFRRYSADVRLARLEDDARAARRGLWADARPVPPWEWRTAAGGRPPRPPPPADPG